ncbi:hypothetical protein MKW92_019557, partial [Papaver armeniacum]
SVCIVKQPKMPKTQKKVIILENLPGDVPRNVEDDGEGSKSSITTTTTTINDDEIEEDNNA